MTQMTEKRTDDLDELAGRLEEGLARLEGVDRPRYRRLWGYYANPATVCGSGDASASARPYRQAQEWGLPPRITGMRSGSEIGTGQPAPGIARKEVVIENDVAWRIDAIVDYLFGKPLVIASAVENPDRRRALTALLNQILDQHGGIVFLQRLALLGAVYGFVDVLVKLNDGGHVSEAFEAGFGGSTETGADDPPQTDAIERLARMIRLEIVEPARALPLASPRDREALDGYAQTWELAEPASAMNGNAGIGHGRQGGLGRLRDLLWLSSDGSRGIRTGINQRRRVVEVITTDQWRRYENDVLMARGRNSLGRIPLVHIQNSALPFSYSGASDLEGLLPLQDELNTRLSDRANRIALQSFKMYLGKGIENFTELPVAPGRMWMSDNEQADVVEFGGDAGCPSEENHIADIREALDKASSVTPVAAGAIKNRIGRLTSAAALRVTLLALLAKTDRKRTTYGRGIERICELSLAWLDRAGVFPTSEAERRVELHWPSPLPENDLEKLQEAEVKARLGVAKEVVLRELGY
jgi:hypothetical protein